MHCYWREFHFNVGLANVSIGIAKLRAQQMKYMTVGVKRVGATPARPDAVSHLSHLMILVVLAVSILVGYPARATAQLSKPEKQRIASAIAADINREIAKYPKEGIAFREKVVGRLVQCGFLFLIISKQSNDQETKIQIYDASEVSLDLSARVSDGIVLDRYKQIADSAEQSIKEKFSAKRTPESEREMNNLLKNCKSFHKVDEVSSAISGLLPPSPQQDNAAAIEFANELQECSLYYALLAAGELIQVPQNSGPLSPADRDKAVKSQVYMTKSEQIEVLYKRLARLAGVTESALSTRRDAMFEQEKRVMTRNWNLSRLHDRYKDFCEYILSDAGGKARLKEISEGYVCGRLYTCW